MRILLAQNSRYYPAHGGGDKSNRLLLEALAALGHECQVAARIPVFGAAEHQRYVAELNARGVTPSEKAKGVLTFERAGVAVHVVANANLRSYFESRIRDFKPQIILTSTDDPAQLLLDAALQDASARVAYLARATLALPFGPDCAFPSKTKTDRIRSADLVVGVSEYVARYIREQAGIPATHVPISLLEPDDWPDIGRFDSEFVTMVNPCAVKGIAIFLALAEAFPEAKFAAVPMWGTNQEDRAALAQRPNITLLDPVDDIDLLLARTRVLLVPSVWAEARSRIVLEAMLRGVPVLASAVGGIPEAKMGVPYLLPVNPISKYQTRVDEQMVPVAEVPPQDVAPWREALGRILCDATHYREISHQSRQAALRYAEGLSARPLERLLSEALKNPRKARVPARSAASQEPAGKLNALSPEKRRLLALKLRQRAPASAWFPGVDAPGPIRLFCFPYAGGGAGAFAGWHAGDAVICPVRLPGRESRFAEAPFEDMAGLVQALAAAIENYLDRPFAFFGHSMGAAVAFELARLLRRRGLPEPRLLIASAARAPQFRRNHNPPPAPTEEEFIAELRRLESIPEEALRDSATLRAILPALQADAALYRRYVYAEEAPLDCPIRAYGGLDDPNITYTHLDAWREQSTASFAIRTFPGGHFFLHGSRSEVLRCIESDLENVRE